MESQKEIDVDASGAAIVCTHVSIERRPILRAVRDQPSYPEDSGWQFTCGSENHDETNGRIWSVNDARSYDATLADVLDLPPYTVLVRTTQDKPWEIETRGLPPEMHN